MEIINQLEEAFGGQLPEDVLPEIETCQEVADAIIKQHELEEVEREKASKTFAVDAPDGSSDTQRKADMEEVENIIEFASSHEDVDAIIKEHEMVQAELERARKIFAVDSPDGTSDADKIIKERALEDDEREKLA